jgi:starch-binding outer membrane protein, SusD/RagB family
MKNIFFIFILFISGFLNSCTNEFLDVAPLNELSDKTFWKDANDAELALNGCYSNWENYTTITFFDAISDNGYTKSAFGKFGNGQITPATYPTTQWTDYIYSSTVRLFYSADWFSYQQMRKYNNFLDNIDNVTMDEAKKSQYKAEVRFLRAYDYFVKVMLFGDMPLVTKLINADEKLKRDPAANIHKFILDELAEIAPSLPVQNNIDSKGHITRGAALALKARLELYLGNFTAALADSKAVIDMSCYELFPDYRKLFLEESETTNKETILDIEYVVNDYPHTWDQYAGISGDGGWSNLVASKNMVDAYECSNGKTIDDAASGYDINNPFKDRDPRLALTILYPGQAWNGRIYNSLDQFLPDGTLNPDYYKYETAARSGLNVSKRINVKAPGMGNWPPNFGNNIIVIRLAEMYLTYAEAAVETGTNTALALEYINKVRKRVGHIAATSLTKELVRRERRVELAFEGLRPFDIRRWDLGSKVMDGPLYGTRLGTMDATGKVTWKGDGKVVNAENYVLIENRVFHPERKYLFPIPLAEMDANPNMVQNPGY